ncbi:hypothetical protein SKAU_G00015140 [Synaphobranchus kaupii]|uniref:Ig-like domain-containing protein n=1 Tax=Synaphobranchus kaupii TaxID=118154 RepID=A0A9Q1GBZ6_SYNKA|nr:hypothetical protein SKAU_G00015140 [Synaphobranchus kaupii]
MLKFFLHLLFLFSLGPYIDCEIILNGEPAYIKCDLEGSSTVLWFRVGKTGMDIIGFVDSNGKVTHNDESTGSTIESKERMEIKHFNKKRDSGVYGCSMTSGQQLLFGKSTILKGPPDPTTTTAPLVTTAPPPSTTTTPCQCKILKKPDSQGSCEVTILAPLVVGCVLLFLILILTIHHCSLYLPSQAQEPHTSQSCNAWKVHLAANSLLVLTGKEIERV